MGQDGAPSRNETEIIWDSPDRPRRDARVFPAELHAEDQVAKAPGASARTLNRRRIAGAAGAGVLLLAVAAGQASLAHGPREMVVAGYGRTTPDSRVYVYFTEGQREVALNVWFGDLVPREDATFRLSSSQTWLPSWDGTIVNHGYYRHQLYLDGLHAPFPMNAARARTVVESLAIQVSGAERARTSTFQASENEASARGGRWEMFQWRIAGLRRGAWNEPTPTPRAVP